MRIKYIVRLDDACPQMNHDNWHRMETLLDKYDVKPIVGIIPNNLDADFIWPEDEQFWERACNWQAKGWTIAQHGYQHLYRPETKRCYYQKSHSLHTEWAGLAAAEQREMMLAGYKLLCSHGLKPTAFFAPAHTFDINTVAACKCIPQIEFISDGYALSSYKKDGMTFIPAIIDGPFLMKYPGIYTFVAHPSVMTEADFFKWDNFLNKGAARVITASQAMEKIRDNQGIAGIMLEHGIYLLRGLRRLFKR